MLGFNDRERIGRCGAVLLASALVLGFQGPSNQEDPDPSLRHEVSKPVTDLAYVPTIRILWNGTLALGDGQPLDPRNWVDVKRLRRWLSSVSARMQKKSFTTPNGTILLPADRLLLRADPMAPFSSVQWLMAQCGSPQIPLWRIHFAAPSPKSPAPTHPLDGSIDLSLPGNRPPTKELYCYVALYIRVVEPGTRFCPGTTTPLDAGSNEPFVFGSNRVLSYQFGQDKSSELAAFQPVLERLYKGNAKWPAYLNFRPEVTCGEALELLNACVAAGTEKFRIAR